MEAAVKAAESGFLTTMCEAAKTLLEASVVVSYGDVRLIADKYGEVLEKKRSVHRILSNTVQFSCELSEKHLEVINGRRTRLANRMLHVIQCLVALWDKIKPYSPTKFRDKVKQATEELMAMAEDIIGYGDGSGLGISAGSGVVREVSVSDSGIASGKAPSMDNLIMLGSQDDLSMNSAKEDLIKNSETDLEDVIFNRLTRDLDSAVLVMDKCWIPSTIPVIVGEVTDYSKGALESVAYKYKGNCRIFIHFGIIYGRRRPTLVHSAVTGVIGLDLITAFNRHTADEFMPWTEPTASYINRLGCGYEVDKIGDAGLGFSCLSPHFRYDTARPHPIVVVEVSHRHENWLGFFLQASMYLGPDTAVRLFVGVRIFVNDEFRMKIYIIKKRLNPKTKQQIMGDSADTCDLALRAKSTQVGTETVHNRGLYKRSVDAINNSFDIEIIHVIDITHEHFNGRLLGNPEEVVFDFPLEVAPGVHRMLRVDFNRTVVQAYGAWQAYMTDRRQGQDQGAAEVVGNLAPALAAEQGVAMAVEQQGDGLVGEQQDEQMAVDDDQEPNEPDEQ